MSKPPAKRDRSPLPADPDDVDTTDIADEVERQIGSLISGSQKAQVLSRIVQIVQKETFSGPIAHPKHLREYESILPGAADRIISMAESNLEHLQDMDRKSLESFREDTKSGRWFGFVALMVLIGAAIATGLHGHVVLAGLFLGAGVLGVITSLINGKNNKTP